MFWCTVSRLYVVAHAALHLGTQVQTVHANTRFCFTSKQAVKCELRVKPFTSSDFFSVTSDAFACTGKSFYGPDGVYPFAGRECARAFAMVSTEVEDCNDNLEDMSPAEMDSLRDWESRFYSKYPIIGNVQSEGQRADAERQKSSRASQAA